MRMWLGENRNALLRNPSVTTTRGALTMGPSLTRAVVVPRASTSSIHLGTSFWYLEYPRLEITHQVKQGRSPSAHIHHSLVHGGLYLLAILRRNSALLLISSIIQLNDFQEKKTESSTQVIILNSCMQHHVYKLFSLQWLASQDVMPSRPLKLFWRLKYTFTKTFHSCNQTVQLGDRPQISLDSHDLDLCHADG